MAAGIHRSPFPDIELVNIDLVSYLFSNPYNAPPDRPIYVNVLSGEARTYNDVIQRTKSLACGLRKLGVNEDDVVAIFSPNSIDYPIMCYAIMGCGATVSPVNSALTYGEVQSQLQTSRAKYVIAHSSLLESAEKAVQGTQVQGIIQADGQKVPSHCIASGDELAVSSLPTSLIVTPPELLDERPAFICFSSGTTGAAKGVIITHRNITANLQQWDRLYFHDTEPSPTAVAFQPFSHIYGITAFICGGLLRGQTTAILSRFDLKVYLSNVQKYKPTELYVVPPIALLLVNNALVDRYDISSVRRILTAAAPMSAELAAALEKSFKTRYGTVVHCHQSWGMTETSPLATGVPPSRMEKRQTVGCIAPNMEFRFVDPETMQDIVTVDSDGTPRPAEILCRGPNVTKGYLHNEKATRDAFYTDPHGIQWLRTGDIAVIDKDGYIVILDRIKEMIKYKGMQVIPSELEGKLQGHPDVDDCGVTAILDAARATELPVAFVVLKPAARSLQPQAVETQIHQWLNARIANHKKLRGGIKFVDSIPKSPSGKILRRKLKEMLNRSQGTAKL